MSRPVKAPEPSDDLDRTCEDGTHVLVVEDEPSLRKLIALTMRRRRLDCDVAANGQEAVERLESKPYRVITLDLMMQGMNGWDVIEWMKQNPRHRPATVVVVTAADRNVFQRLDPSMVNAVFVKPFDIHTLGAYVSSACRRKAPDRRHMRVI